MTGRSIAHYRIIEKLGEGGMGEVYKAVDTRLDRTVAIKFVKEQFSERFTREAKAIAALNHPHICSLYDVGVHEGASYLVMEYVQGERLAGPMAPDKALEFATQMADALSAAHREGIIHRDLKPGNILVAAGGIKLVDFGLAKRSAKAAGGAPDVTAPTETETAAGTVVGTVAYMSPEQARGQEVDARSDIFSFGAVLYELLTGRRPFQGPTNLDTLSAILREDPLPPSRFKKGLPAELDAVILKALAKNPANRYQSAGQLEAELRRMESRLAGRPRIRLKHLSVLLVAAVLLLTAAGAVYWITARRGATEEASVAVLPLDNLSRNPEEDFFSAGITDALISELGSVRGLRVISRTTAMRYKGAGKPLPEIARELNVKHVVEGSVLRAEGRVRITAQLVDAAQDKQIWSKRYERDLKDILAVQSDLARAIAEEVRGALTPEQQARLSKVRQVNPEAHEAYVRGRFLWNNRTAEDLIKSLEHMRRAIELDPANPLAHAGLADCYNMLGAYNVLAPEDAYPKAKAAAQKALELDNSLAEAHNALAYLNNWYFWDWAAAEKGYQHAIELKPGYETARSWYGWYLLGAGRADEAVRQMIRASESDPLSLVISSSLGLAYIIQRKYDLAITQLNRTAEMNPSFPRTLFWLGQAYLHKKAFREAFDTLSRAVSVSRGSPEYLGALGHAYGAGGRSADARRILSQLDELSRRRYVSPYDIALVHLGLGDKDATFLWLNKAVDAHSSWLTMLKVEPRMDPLRGDPRFAAVLKRIGLDR